MSKRGKGTCATCQQQYGNRNKPAYCSCGAYLGGHFIPKKKKIISAPEVVQLVRNIYSAKTSSRNDRCLVMKEGQQWICLRANCLRDRAAFVSSGNADGFDCNHINLARKGAVSKPTDIWTPTESDIESYEGGQSVQTELKRVVQGLTPPQPAVITVCEDRFVVFGLPTATNTLGYCHVRKEEANLLCASKDCQGCVARCKSEKQKNICIHLHLLLLYNKVKKKIFKQAEDAPYPAEAEFEPEQLPEDPGPSSRLSVNQHQTTSTLTSELELNSNGAAEMIFGQQENANCPSGVMESAPAPEQLTDDVISSTSRKSTLELISEKIKLPYEITKETHIMIDDFNAISHLGVPLAGQVGWPSEFAPIEEKCGRCESHLGPKRTHPGSRGENKGMAYLVTNMTPFRMITIYVRFCCNSNCKAMHQADTLKLGEYAKQNRIQQRIRQRIISGVRDKPKENMKLGSLKNGSQKIGEG